MKPKASTSGGSAIGSRYRMRAATPRRAARAVDRIGQRQADRARTTTQVDAGDREAAPNARRKLGSAATSRYHSAVKPVGSSVLVHSSPNEPTTSSAIGMNEVDQVERGDPAWHGATGCYHRRHHERAGRPRASNCAPLGASGILRERGGPMTARDQVDYVSGKTRLFGIVGHPIEQVRSPEMITAEMTRPRARRGARADARAAGRVRRPSCRSSCACAISAGSCSRFRTRRARAPWPTSSGRRRARRRHQRARARHATASWRGDIFDGLGCVEAFRRRGIAFAGKRVMLDRRRRRGIGDRSGDRRREPASLTIFDVDPGARMRARASRGGASPHPPSRSAVTVDGIDILLNATPVGMLDDARLPLAVDAHAAASWSCSTRSSSRSARRCSCSPSAAAARPYTAAK